MSLTIRKTGLLNSAHLPASLKPHKGKTLVVHVETPSWADPPSHPDYTVMHCTEFGGRLEVRAQYTSEPPEGSRPYANDEERNFIVDVRNLIIQHSLDAVEFSSHYDRLF